MNPILVSISDFYALLGIKRTKAFDLIRKREVEVVKIGSRTLVKYSSIEAFIERAVAKAEADRNA